MFDVETSLFKNSSQFLNFILVGATGMYIYISRYILFLSRYILFLSFYILLFLQILIPEILIPSLYNTSIYVSTILLLIFNFRFVNLCVLYITDGQKLLNTYREELITRSRIIGGQEFKNMRNSSNVT